MRSASSSHCCLRPCLPCGTSWGGDLRDCCRLSAWQSLLQVERGFQASTGVFILRGSGHFPPPLPLQKACWGAASRRGLAGPGPQSSLPCWLRGHSSHRGLLWLLCPLCCWRVIGYRITALSSPWSVRQEHRAKAVLLPLSCPAGLGCSPLGRGSAGPTSLRLQQAYLCWGRHLLPALGTWNITGLLIYRLMHYKKTKSAFSLFLSKNKSHLLDLLCTQVRETLSVLLFDCT